MKVSIKCYEENQVMLIWEFLQIYIDIWKHHCEKAEMGLVDPKLLLGHVSFDGQVCAI